jgi:hypothetical protein
MEQNGKEMSFRPDRVLPAGIRTSALPVLFFGLQLPVEQRFLKREMRTRMMGLQKRIPQRRGRIAFHALPCVLAIH